MRSVKILGPAVLALALTLTACGDPSSGNAPSATSDGKPSSSETKADKKPGEEDVVLTAVSPFPEGDAAMESFFMITERLEAEVPGLTIDYRGGPDTMSPFDMAEGVSNGTIDMAAVPTAYYEGLLPWANGMDLLSPLTPTELRENGIWDFLVDKHEEEMNVHALGDTTPLLGYQLYLNKEVSSMADLSGLQLRSAGKEPMFDAMGASTIQMPGGEIYTAMDRGVVDGFRWTALGITSLGLEEVTDYEMLPAYYQSCQPLLMNLDKWQSLSEDMRQAITDTVTSMDQELVDYHKDVVLSEREERAAAGMKAVELEDGDEFLTTATNAKWDVVIKQNPQLQELRDMYEEAIK